uniref:Uncharacterized protein n=1 Tax=Rhizophora mucronata TaxID=61149 RepID=A0A2P2N6C0_RHIMU
MSTQDDDSLITLPIFIIHPMLIYTLLYSINESRDFPILVPRQHVIWKG